MISIEKRTEKYSSQFLLNSSKILKKRDSV